MSTLATGTESDSGGFALPDAPAAHGREQFAPARLPLASTPPVAELLPRAMGGEQAAVDLLLRNMQDVWLRFCFSILADRELAREATQETALRVLERLPSFRGRSEWTTWSLGIALNVCREMRRHARRWPRQGGDVADVNPAAPGDAGAALIEREQRGRLFELLEALSPRQRQALVLRYFEELSLQAVARVMGCATGTAKATIAQALRALRQRWESKP